MGSRNKRLYVGTGQLSVGLLKLVVKPKPAFIIINRFGTLGSDRGAVAAQEVVS